MKPTALMDTVEAVLGKRAAMLTISEFATVTGRHYQTIYNLVARGEIPANQRMKHGPYLIPYQELAPWLATRAAA